MAAYTWTNISDQAKAFVKGIPLSTGATDVSIVAADNINSIIWQHYPWSWSLRDINTVTCSNYVQDYTFSIPGPVSGMRPISVRLLAVNPALQITAIFNVGVFQITTSGGENNISTGDIVRIAGINGATTANGVWTVTRVNLNNFTLDGSSATGTYTDGGWCTKGSIQISELNIVEYLSPEMMIQGGVNTIRDISYVGQSGKFRLEKAASVPSGTALLIDAVFQFVPTKVTALATAIPFLDAYVDVGIEGYLWQMYKFTGDTRAGTVQINREGRKEYTGQLGVFMDALETMKRTEDQASGEGTMFPDDPLGYGKSGAGYGLFPNF